MTDEIASVSEPDLVSSQVIMSCQQRETFKSGFYCNPKISPCLLGPGGEGNTKVILTGRDIKIFRRAQKMHALWEGVKSVNLLKMLFL